MTERQRSYEASRQEVADLDARLQNARMSVNVDNPSAVAQFRQLLAERDAAFKQSSGEVLAVNQAATAQYNQAVAAYNGHVFVSYGTRNTAVHGGNLVQQQVITSANGGATFRPAISLGRPSDLRFSAVAGGHFPGDYIGASATTTRLNLVWCLSSKPGNPNAAYHQTLYSAVLRP